MSILYQMLRAKPQASPDLAPSVPKLLTMTVPQVTPPLASPHVHAAMRRAVSIPARDSA